MAPWHSASVSRYLRILRQRAALMPFAAAVAARLPISMGPLGIVLLVQQVRGSYTSAAAVTAAFALATSVSAPLLGRAMDRVGQPRVILAAAGVSALLLATLAVVTVRGGGDLVLVALSAGAGLAFPPITPAMRGAWRVVLDTPDDRAAAYAMDAVAVESIFVGGPLLLSALLVLAPPAVPLLVTAALLLCGSWGYGLSAAARSWRPERADPAGPVADTSPLRAPGVPAVLLVALAMAVGFGQVDVSIAATARLTLHDPGRVGLLFAAIAGGSASGGLWYGARSWRRPERRRLPVLLGGFAFGLTVVLFTLLRRADGPLLLPVLLPVLFLTGLGIAPALIIQQALVDRLAPGHRLGEAQAWLNTGFTAGSAGGTAVAGVLVDVAGPAASFAGAAVAVALATAVAVAAQQRWA